METNPKEIDQLSKAKSLLSCRDCILAEYKKWRGRIKGYVVIKGIKGRRGTSSAAWESYREFTQEPKNGLYSSGRKMIR